MNCVVHLRFVSSEFKSISNAVKLDILKTSEYKCNNSLTVNRLHRFPAFFVMFYQPFL